MTTDRDAAGPRDTADETLSEAFWSVARQLRETSQETLAPWDITPSHLRALRVLKRHGPMRLSALSDHLHIAARSATEVVDGLEARGLVKRRPDPGDRRATLVEVTEHGAGRPGRHPRGPRHRGGARLRQAQPGRPRRPGPHPAQAPGLTVTGLAAGTRIAGYLLEEQVGAGGMAVVFRARDERLDRQVALKILPPPVASKELRQRFLREARAAAAIDDPHIIPVYEAGEADGVLFIAMRYVAGGDVGSLLRRRGALPPERAGAVISPVASALDAAHQAGLVHRDVKPANMLLDARPGRADHVYLADFGISHAALTSVRLTQSGEFIGTLAYSAPEQIAGEAADGRADEYALACAAFELLTGAPPFRREPRR